MNIEGQHPPDKIRAVIYGRRYIVTETGMILTMGIKGGSNFRIQYGEAARTERRPR